MKIKNKDFYKYFKFIEKHLWLIFSGVAFVTGLIGYYKYYLSLAEIESIGAVILNSAYSSIRLFALELDIDVNEVISIPILIEIGRWVAPLGSLFTILKAVEAALYQRVRLIKFGWYGNHYIICGLNENTKVLIDNLIDDKKNVIVIDENKDNPYLQYVKDRKAVYIQGSPTELSILSKAHVAKCSYIIIFSLNDALNTETLLNVTKSLSIKPTKKIKNPVKCIVHIINKEFEQVIDDIENDIQTIKHKIDIRIFNKYENSAKILFSEHPLYYGIPRFTEHTDVLGNANLVIVGFGNAGENILVYAAKTAHFSNTLKTKIIVVDIQAKQKEIWFKLRYPYIDKVCNITFEEIDVFSKDFYEKFLLANRSITYTVFCFDDDQTNFLCASHMMKQLSLNKKMDTPIAIRISKDNNFAKWIDQNKSISFNNIYTYGSINKVSGADVVINEKPDILAKAIHEVYRNGKGDQWENISIFKKDSCRAQADHLSAKLYLAGLRLTQKQDVKDDMKYISSEEEFQRIISPYIEELAILEHIRWNAFHFVNGWTVQDPLLEKDEINKKHYCLVDWEQLDMVSDIKKCNFKEYDREFIRNIYKYLEGTDYVICFLGESGDG